MERELTSRAGDSDDEGTPFESEIQAYERADELCPPPTAPILFYGSSSIRLWSLEDDFRGYPVLNRGFGGARLQDCVRLFPRLVKTYSPSGIVLYAGDNDLVDGRSPQEMQNFLREFVDLVSKNLPSVPVAFISIKPSPARLHYRNEIEETNRLIEDFALQQGNLTFLNVYDKMLGPQRSFLGKWFLEDGLHMNRAGYDIWKEVVAPYLSLVWKETVTSSEDRS
jgi:lysophospholipase L1-like esterase